MGRTKNEEHVRRTLQALAILQSESGWHRVTELAERVGASSPRLADDLRRLHYSAGMHSVPVIFGDEVEPAEPEGGSVVRYEQDFPLRLPLPASRVELTRIALLAETAPKLFDLGPSAQVLSDLGSRLSALLGLDPDVVADRKSSVPDIVTVLREAIETGGVVQFAYRSLERSELAQRRVRPIRVRPVSMSWVLDADDLDTESARCYRVDRIVGPLTVEPSVAGPAAGAAAHGPAVSPPDRTRVRVRVGEDEEWALENFEPTDKRYVRQTLNGTTSMMLEATISLYPPVERRLSRLLLLLRPGAAVVETENTGSESVLHVHRETLRALGELYGVVP